MIQEKCFYTVEVNHDDTGLDRFSFWLTATPENSQEERQKWKIVKSEDSIIQLNSKIEEECKLSVSFYYQLLSQGQGQHYRKKA